MGYQIGDRKLPLDVAWTDADGIQRPANWLRLSTQRDRELLGITWVADTSNNYDQRFYWSESNPKQLNDEAILDEDGNDTGEVQTGLKTLWKTKQEQFASNLLAPSDWRVVKAAEVTDYAVSSQWLTYRAAVRTACNTRQGEIDACSDVATLKELLYGDAQVQQTDSDGNGVVDSDNNPVMIKNPAIATAWPTPI